MYIVSFERDGGTVAYSEGNLDLASYTVKHASALALRRAGSDAWTVRILIRDAEGESTTVLELIGDAETVGVVAKRKIATLRKQANVAFGVDPGTVPAPEVSYGDAV